MADLRDDSHDELAIPESRSVSPVDETNSLIAPATGSDHPSTPTTSHSQALPPPQTDPDPAAQQLDPAVSVASHERGEEKHSSGTGTACHGAHLWTPVELHLITVMSFVALYGVLIVALLVMLVVDRRNLGLATSRFSLHYLWTYGPTLGECSILRMARANISSLVGGCNLMGSY